MTIKVGDKLPDGFFRVKDDEGNPQNVTIKDLFAGQKVVDLQQFATICDKM